MLGHDVIHVNRLARFNVRPEALETGQFKREDNYARMWADKKLIDEADMQRDPFGNEEDERRTPIAATTTFSADSKEAHKVGLEREANQSTTKSLNGENGSSPAADDCTHKLELLDLLLFLAIWS